MPIPATPYIWSNGKLVAWEKATVHVLSLSLIHIYHLHRRALLQIHRRRRRRQVLGLLGLYDGGLQDGLHVACALVGKAADERPDHQYVHDDDRREGDQPP